MRRGTLKSRRRPSRVKLSTTIAPESDGYLRQLIKSGAAANVAEAIDLALARLKRLDNRLRLERDTAAYFAGLSPEGKQEEDELGGALGSLAKGIDFDHEP